MHLRLHLKVAFDGALEGALVSAAKDALEGKSEGAPKSVLQDIYIKMYQKIHLRLNLRVHFKIELSFQLHTLMHCLCTRVQKNNSMKGEFKCSLCVALEGASKIFFHGAQKCEERDTFYVVIDGLLDRAIKDVLEGAPKGCWFCIYFKRIYFGTPSDDCF